MSATCPACNKELASITGYNRHLAKTTNPACRALYLASQQFRSSPPAPDQQDNESDMDIGDVPDPNQSPPHFEGDFFGIYAKDELEWPAEFGDGGDADNKPVDEEDSEDEGDEGDAHDEWEPPLFASPHDTHEEDNEDEHDGTQDPHTPDAQEPDARHRVEQRLRDHEQAPTVVHYPDRRAGQPINPTKQSSNVTYCAQLDGSGADNAYAPFASKLDWEMARWAKLRGPSSTAFSELISIEGVSSWHLSKSSGLV